MKKFLFVFFILIAICTIFVNSRIYELILPQLPPQYEFDIKERLLESVPSSIEAAIRREKEWNKCKFIGKKLALSKDRLKDFYAVTTSEGCGWNAGEGPIWIAKAAGRIVELIGIKASILMEASGYSLLVMDGYDDDMHDIVIASASHEEKGRWGFHNGHYEQIKQVAYNQEEQDKAAASFNFNDYPTYKMAFAELRKIFSGRDRKFIERILKQKMSLVRQEGPTYNSIEGDPNFWTYINYHSYYIYNIKRPSGSFSIMVMFDKLDHPISIEPLTFRNVSH